MRNIYSRSSSFSALKTQRAVLFKAFFLYCLAVLVLAQPGHGQAPSPYRTLDASAAGILFICPDGNVYANGSNRFLQVANNHTLFYSPPIRRWELQDIIAVETWSRHNMALKMDGTVWAWGNNEFGQAGSGNKNLNGVPLKVEGLPEIVQLAAGSDFSLALDREGRVWAWGHNHIGQCGQGNQVETIRRPAVVTGLPPIKSIAAGTYHGTALARNGSVWSWGYNPMGSLGDGTLEMRTRPVQTQVPSNIRRVACGDFHCLCVTDQGEVWAWGNNKGRHLTPGAETLSKPVKIKGLQQISDVAAGTTHSLALQREGAVYAWGINMQGEVGVGSVNQIQTPVKLEGLPRIVELTAGWWFSGARDKDGLIWLWGLNASGQIATGDTKLRDRPTRLSFECPCKEPEAFIIGDSLIKAGETAELVAYGGARYEWNNGKVTDRIKVNPTETTIYNVRVIDKGCFKTAEFMVEVEAADPDEVKKKEEIVFAERKVKVDHEVPIVGGKVKIALWDMKRIDNDTVSLSFNGEWVLQNYGLRAQKKILELELVPGRDNVLILHAENEGLIPPNTAAIGIKDDEKTKYFILRSDLQSSAAIRLSKGE